MPEQQFTKEMTEALNTRAVKVKKIKLVLSGQPNLIFLPFKEEIFFTQTGALSVVVDIKLEDLQTTHS